MGINIRLKDATHGANSRHRRHRRPAMADYQTVRHDPTYPEKLDKEIVSLCDALNEAGLVTTTSCCGHGSFHPTVWFEHPGDDSRIESLARYVLAAENHPCAPHITLFYRQVER